MSTVQNEITQLEERLRLAELGPDPAFFQEALDEQAVVISQTGEQATKDKIVEAHRRGKGPKFTSIEMSERRILDHGTTAVVTCKGTYEGPEWSGTLKFMRVWLKKNGTWRVIAASVANAN